LTSRHSFIQQKTMWHMGNSVCSSNFFLAWS